MINNNLLKVYSAQGEFEGTQNSIGQRQNDLIKKIALSMEWSVLNKSDEGDRSKKPLVQIPKFSPSAIGYKFEPINLHHSHRHERRRKYLTLFFLPIFRLLYLISHTLNIE